MNFLARFVITALGIVALAAIAKGQTCPGNDPFENNDDCASAWPLIGGTYPHLAVHSNDEDFFRVRVLPYEVLRVDLDFQHALGDLDLYLYEAAHPLCGDPSGPAVLAASTTLTDHESLTFTNNDEAACTLVVHVDWYWQATPGCNDYTLTVDLAGPCPGNDSIEPNDSCGAAADIGAGFFGALALHGADQDYFAIDVGDGDVLTVDVLFRHGDGDLDAALFAADCATIVAASTSTTDDERIVFVNSSGGTERYRIWLYQYGTTACVDYSMRVQLEGCGLVPDDAFEDNDDCAHAAPLGLGFYPALQVFDDDEDYFFFVLQDGDEALVELRHDAARGDIDLYAFLDTDPACGNIGGQWISRSVGTGDLERMSWANLSGHPVGVVVFVDWYPSQPGCNAYDLLLGAAPFGTLSHVFCLGRPNSTGLPATLEAAGSRFVASNDLRLWSGQLPLASFGYFLNARWAGVLDPPGSVGQLCLVDGAVGRYNRAGEVRSSGMTGAVELQLDLFDTPTPLGVQAIAPGESWSFQYWYRDVASGGGATSNLSDAIRVRFL